MKKTFTPTPGEVVIDINEHYQRFHYVVLITSLPLAGLLYWWLGDNGYPDWQTSPTVWVVYGVLCCLVIGWGHLIKGKKVIVSSSEQAIYSQWYFGKQNLMAYADVGAIKPYQDANGKTYFGLFSHENLYERNPIRISPVFTTGAQSDAQYDEFDQATLPRVWAVINSNSRQVFSTQSQAEQPVRTAPAPEVAKLTYYRTHSGGYTLRKPFSRILSGLLLPAVLLLFSLSFSFDTTGNQTYTFLRIGFTTAAFIAIFLLTVERRFQPGEFVVQYPGGLFRRTYAMSQFSTYEIMHRSYYNVIRTGTDVSLIFLINGRQKFLFLRHVRRTKNIEDLIDETNYIVDELA